MLIPYEQDDYPILSNPIERAGRYFRIKMRNFGRSLLLCIFAFAYLPLFYKRRDEIARQIFLAGIRSFGVTALVALFTGMILALQAGLLMKDYGKADLVGTLVSQSMCREMGPIMTGLIIAACVGASMAAQLGSMATSEEIAALDVMGINPVKFLVMPRLFAMLLMCPALTIYTNIIGIAGGGVVAYTQLDVSWAVYYDSALQMLKAKEIYVGVLKSIVFAILIVTISCYKGMAATGGAVGVGSATRRAVVGSFLGIIISGYVITRLFY